MFACLRHPGYGHANACLHWPGTYTYLNTNLQICKPVQHPPLLPTPLLHRSLIINTIQSTAAALYISLKHKYRMEVQIVPKLAYLACASHVAIGQASSHSTGEWSRSGAETTRSISAHLRHHFVFRSSISSAMWQNTARNGRHLLDICP